MENRESGVGTSQTDRKKFLLGAFGITLGGGLLARGDDAQKVSRREGKPSTGSFQVKRDPRTREWDPLG